MSAGARLPGLAAILLVGLPWPGAAQRVPSDPMPIMMLVGCVDTAADAADGVRLTRATAPEAVTDRLPEQPAAETPLGTGTVRLIGTLDEFGVAAHVGHKVWVKGLLIEDEDGDERRLNLVSITHLSPSCS